MHSFDIVNRVDLQEIDNAVNNTRKEIATRYDFRGSKTQVSFDRKEKKLQMSTEDKMKMEAVQEMFLNHAVKRKVDIKAFDFKEPEPAAGSTLRREVVVREGLDQDMARKIVKLIKDAKIKVQASIQGDEVRVSGKQIDDLQGVIAMLKTSDIGVPLQFVNMKS